MRPESAALPTPRTSQGGSSEKGTAINGSSVRVVRKEANRLNKPRPSERNIAVLAALVRYGSQIAAASHLGLTIDAVKWHIKELCRKTGYVTAYQLVAWAFIEGYLDKTVCSWENCSNR